MASNSENTVWNNLHNGARVPINDTDLSGAPAALSSANSSWSEGSLNKAVKDTWDANLGAVDAEDQIDYDAGVLDLKRLSKYIYQDMLYGYKGDSVDSLPGDMMSYRGYPTPILVSEGIQLEFPNSNVNWNYDGSVGALSGSYLISKYVATIEYALGYDLSWEIFYTPPSGAGDGILLKVYIAAGFTQITGYSIGASEVYSLPQNAIFFSYSTAISTGDLILRTTAEALAQAPTYGVVPGITTITVTEAEYSPVTPPSYFQWTTAFKSPRIWLDCVIIGCAEAPEGDIKHLAGNERTMYAAYGDPVVVGSRLYKNLSGVAWDEPATYCNAAWVYYSTSAGQNIYSISRIFTVDASGYITFLKLKASEPYCWEFDPCL